MRHCNPFFCFRVGWYGNGIRNGIRVYNWAEKLALVSHVNCCLTIQSKATHLISSCPNSREIYWQHYRTQIDLKWSYTTYFLNRIVTFLKQAITIPHKYTTLFCTTFKLSPKITDLSYSETVILNLSHVLVVHYFLSIWFMLLLKSKIFGK